MNILNSKEVIIDLFKKNIIFTRYQNLSMFVQFTTRDNVRIRKIVRAKRKQTISSRLIEIIIVFLKEKKPLLNRDFLFEPQIKSVYFHFINAGFNFINVYNDDDSLFIISRYYKIDSIMEYEAKKAYFVNLKNHFLIAKFSREKKSMLFEFTNLLNSKSALRKIRVDPILKIKLFNDITIYGKQEYVKIMKSLTKENPRI